MHVLQTRQCVKSGSAIRNQDMCVHEGGGGGRWQAARWSDKGGNDSGWIEMGVLTPMATELHGGGSRSRGDDSEVGETEDRLGHRRKHGGEHRCARP
jgi:hypothetical protein